MAHKISRFGWLPDLPDQRDFVYSAPRPIKAKLPAKVDLRKQCPVGRRLYLRPRFVNKKTT